MKHIMRINNGPFESIKAQTKTIELRLNDKKRKLINIGDIIEFENRITFEKIKVKVLNLHKYTSFEELYKHFDKVVLGYQEYEEANPNDMEQYYSKEEQKKYGVLGIEINLINNQKKEIIHNNDNLSINDINNVVRRAKILFVNNDELTLCYSNYNYFLLGGHVDDNESDIDCLTREIVEEAGVELKLEDLEPFITIKYLNKDYPCDGKNTFTMANYYILNYNLVPNYEKTQLTEVEKNGGFKIVNINKQDVIKVLEESLNGATRKGVTMDTIEVIKEYLKDETK